MSNTQRVAGVNARQQLLAGLPVTERRVELAGVSTAVLEGGDGPPIVLLQVEFAAIWMRVIPDLVATNRVVAPDLPGLGASRLTGGPPDEERVLRWLGELVDRTCASPPVLVGKGPAGALAARFAIEAGERVSGLVLVDSHGLARFRPPLGMALTFISVLLRPSARGLERGFRNYCFTDLDSLRAEMGERYDWMASYALDRFSTPEVRKAMRGMMPWLSAAIPPEQLARIAVPTTLIWGRHDVGMPLRVAEEASARHGWPLHVIDGARDDPAIERPEAFLAALSGALGQR